MAAALKVSHAPEENLLILVEEYLRELGYGGCLADPVDPEGEDDKGYMALSVRRGFSTGSSRPSISSHHCLLQVLVRLDPAHLPATSEGRDNDLGRFEPPSANMTASSIPSKACFVEALSFDHPFKLGLELGPRLGESVPYLVENAHTASVIWILADCDAAGLAGSVRQRPALFSGRAGLPLLAFRLVRLSADLAHALIVDDADAGPVAA